MMRTATRADVVVVGSGPAGATAARRLAEAGVGVTLVERAALPRYKTCGGGVVARALRDLPAADGMPIEARCHRVEARFGDLGLQFVVERADPIVAMTMRAELDQALVDAARSAGVVVRERCTVTGLRVEPDRARVETSGGAIEAAFVVGADGVLGPTARHAGWTDAPGTVPALEAEVRVSPRVLDRFAGTARFDLGTPPRGYGWVFPKRAHLSVGVGALERGPVRLREHLASYLARLGLGAPEARDVHGYVIPVRRRRQGFARGRVLLVGDAAGLADPLTGEGISYAIWSGRLLAEALLAETPHPEAVARRYVAALAPVLAELKIAAVLGRILYEHPGLVRRLVPRVGHLAAQALTDVIAGHRSYRSLVRRGLTWRRLVRALLR